MSLSIALTKGRLEKQTVGMLEECGYGIESLKNKGRALVFPDSVYDIQYFLVFLLYNLRHQHLFLNLNQFYF